jgi:hypothetical protein
MKQGLLLVQYGVEMQRLGRDAFENACPWPALVGIGLLDTPGDAQKVKDRATVMFNVTSMKEGLAGSVTDRVWFIRRNKDAGRRSAGIWVGRGVDNDVPIPDQSLSVNHCEFLEEVVGYRLVDRGALNGTRLDRELLKANTPVRLKDLQTIALGRLEFQFLLPRTFATRLAKLIGLE